VVFTYAYEQLFSFSFHLLAFTKTAEPALRQSRREKPSALLYQPIIKPQHLWLDCYFFFVSSNKEKVTKKACPEQGQGKTYLTFFLSDEKESKQRKNRRHRFIGQFFLYTNGVNLSTLFSPCLLNYMAFSSSHPVLIQKPRRSPLRRSKLLLYTIAVNTLYL